MTKKINFEDLSFEKFQELASMPSLTRHEKVGFPNSYRDGKEAAIFSDVISKINKIMEGDKIVLEIGPGCSELPIMLANLCRTKKNKLHFVDGPEMLDLLPNEKHIFKWPGKYPEIANHPNFISNNVDIILAYSVIQYIFWDGDFWEFLEKSLDLLNEGGQMLLGDIPNSSMRNRFLSGSEGAKFKKNVLDNAVFTLAMDEEISQIDDDFIGKILFKARSKGFHAWVLRQGHNLPMSNRREDILIERP